MSRLILILCIFLLGASPLIEADRLLGEDLSSYPGIWPVRGRITSYFGMRRDPFTGHWRYHEGLDIACPRGTPVRASGCGTVAFSGVSVKYRGYGIIVVVVQGGAEVYYAHLKDSTVEVGDRVRRGQIIGFVGNAGRSTGTHLHYQINLRGRPTDPLRFIVR